MCFLHIKKYKTNHWYVIRKISLSQPLWYNKNIQINNKSVFYQSWFNKGIIYFNDLLNEDGSFLTFEEFQHKFMIRTNFITFMGIKTAIIRYMRFFNMNDLLTPLIGPIIPFNIKIFIFTNKGSKNMYNLQNKTNVEPTGNKNGTEFSFYKTWSGKIYIVFLFIAHKTQNYNGSNIV